MHTYETEAGPGGLKAPDTVATGAVEFHVSSTGPGGTWLGLVRLAEEIPLETHMANLRRAYGRGQEAIAASWVVDREFTMLGGAAVTAECPVSFSVELTEGTYHLLDYKRLKDDDTGADPVAHAVRAEPGPGTSTAALPEASADIVQKHTAHGPRFFGPDRIRSGAALRITNWTEQYNEAVLMAVRDDATEVQVEAFFAAIAGGQRPPVPDLVRSEPVGSVPLSHGRSVVFTSRLAPGRYVLATWITNHRTARMFAMEGMHKLVTVV